MLSLSPHHSFFLFSTSSISVIRLLRQLLIIDLTDIDTLLLTKVYPVPQYTLCIIRSPGFDEYILPCLHHYGVLTNLLCSTCSPFPLLPDPWPPLISFLSPQFYFSRMLYRYNQTVDDLFKLASFTLQYALFLSYLFVASSLFFLIVEQYTTEWMYHSLFIHSPLKSILFDLRFW